MNKKPNVILMFVDDLGYGDVGCFNPECKIPTPAIDKLARDGMMFTDSHASSAVCTPSRYSLMTGRYPFRSRLKAGVICGDSMTLIEKGRMTLADLFKEQGYRTACVGKWHLGMEWHLKNDIMDTPVFGDGTHYDNVPVRGTEPTPAPLISTWVEGLDIDYTKPIIYGPNDYGFDYFYGTTASIDQPPYIIIENKDITQQPTRMSGHMVLERLTSKMQDGWQLGPIADNYNHETILDDMNDKVLDLIDDYAGTDEPFFIYYSTPAVHGPLLPNDKFKGKSGLNAYGDIVMQLDDMVAQIREKLEATGVADNTMIIFTSDNGCSGVADFPLLQSNGHFPSYIYKGNKFSLYEGGHKVPTIVTYPGQIKEGTKNNANICHTDFFATFAEMFGVELSDDVAEDSFTNFGLWKGDETCERTATIYSGGTGFLSVLKDGYKLVFAHDGGTDKETIGAIFTGKNAIQTFEMYNLNEDPSETKDIYHECPEKVEELRQELIRLFDNGRSTKGAIQENWVPEEWFQVNFK